MTIRKVVGVCAGNVQRSATFDAVFNYTLSQKEEKSIEIEGAGAFVKKILTNTTSLPNMIRIIDAGLYYGAVRKENRQTAIDLIQKLSQQDYSPSAFDMAQIGAIYTETRPIVHGMLMLYRNIALERAGIPKQFHPGIYNPFKLDDKTGLVLAMDNKVLEKLKEDIGSNPNVVLQTYGSLVGQQTLEDDLKSGLEGAVRQVDYFMSTREKAFDEMFKLIKA